MNIKEIIYKILHIKYRYLICRFSYVYVDGSSTIKIGKKTDIRFCKIHLTNNSRFETGNKVKLDHTRFSINNGSVYVGDNSVIDNGNMPFKQNIIITHGVLNISENNRIRCSRIWIRFNGSVCTDKFVNINDYSEIRCDEKISIGAFTEISYFVNIWDTNTHEFEDFKKRRDRWKAEYLNRDVSRKPQTKPILIGSDNWIGEKSSILKGTTIGNKCIVGYSTTLSNANIPEGSKVVNQIYLKYIK